LSWVLFRMKFESSWALCTLLFPYLLLTKSWFSLPIESKIFEQIWLIPNHIWRFWMFDWRSLMNFGGVHDLPLRGTDKYIRRSNQKVWNSMHRHFCRYFELTLLGLAPVMDRPITIGLIWNVMKLVIQAHDTEQYSWPRVTEMGIYRGYKVPDPPPTFTFTQHREIVFPLFRRIPWPAYNWECKFRYVIVDQLPVVHLPDRPRGCLAGHSRLRGHIQKVHDCKLDSILFFTLL
jgi:hypothetical protein